MKPAKFSASIAIYTLTLAWVHTYLPEWRKTRRIVSWVSTIVFILEIVIIDLQAWRGTTSHFNVGTVFDGVMFSMMGLAIVVQTLTAVAVAVPVVLAAIYSAIVALRFFGAQGGFSSLADVALLFSNPWMLLAGWIHYLAFDLLIGTWEARDVRDRGIPHLLVLPCLTGTFLFGPAGWLLYLGVRSMYGRAMQPQLQAGV